MTDDLIARLRATAEADAAYGYEARGGLFDEAADRIKRLEAENARLREVLKDALSLCYNCGGDPHYIEEDEVTGDHLWTDCPNCKNARAALKNASNGSPTGPSQTLTLPTPGRRVRRLI